MCLQCTEWVFGGYIVHFLVVSLQCSHQVHHPLPPVSGVSLHFTGDINDFVEYTPFEQVVPVDTANSTTSIEGKGTVILLLASGEYVRIYPVHYVPDMKVKLLSLGTFLRAGHQSIGTAHFIKVLKNGSPFLNFVPRRRNDSIYVIRACVVDETDLHYAIDSVYNFDYDIVHKRLGHPSKDVIQKARKHLKDFPEVEVPTEDHICPGCAQGKMTNRSFPPTQQRASQPFELIHSDLKSFPIKSYRRFKYVIVFFDDYTSNAWTITMHTKDAACQEPNFRAI